jgi:hypothetical protein
MVKLKVKRESPMAKQKPKVKRSLYQCFWAKVIGNKIVCAQGFSLTLIGTVNIERLKRGMPLEVDVCQECPAYQEMGPPVPPGERGWIDRSRK